jgi:hypothetical protein
MTDDTRDLIALLRTFYTDAEAFAWLTLPQPQHDGAIPLDIIGDGRVSDLVVSLRRMDEGVYL